jgi:hypothetical protein
MSDSTDELMSNIQPYLLANAEELAKYCGRTELEPDAAGLGTFHGGKPGFPLSSTMDYIPQPIFVKKVVPDKRSYSPTHQGDNISDLFNAFENKTSLDFVATLPDNLRSELIPNPRIYKHFVFGDKHEHSVDLELASAYFNPETQVVDDGVVLRDVEFVYKGQTPAETETNIDVTIRLFATKLGKYFDLQKPEPIYSSTVAKNTAKDDRVIKSFTEKGVTWLDLLKINIGGDLPENMGLVAYLNSIGKETEKQIIGEASRANNTLEHAQRIKLEVGYRIPEDSVFTDLGYQDNEIAAYKKLIGAQKKIYILSLVQHNISFNSDGSAEIQIDYQASGGTTVFDRKSDLLYDPYIEELINTYMDDISVCNHNFSNGKEVTLHLDPITADWEGKFSDGTHAQMGFSGRGTQPDWDSDKLTEKVSTRDAKREAIKRRNQYIRKLRIGQAKLLINGLYGPWLHVDDASGTLTPHRRANRSIDASRVWHHTVSAFDLLGVVPPTISRVDNTSQGVGGKILIRPYSQLIFTNDGTTPNYREYSRASDLETANEKVKGTFQGLGKGSAFEMKREVQFVFFGDILEVAFEILASNNRFGTSENTDRKYFRASPMLGRMGDVENLDDWMAYANVTSFFKMANFYDYMWTRHRGSENQEPGLGTWRFDWSDMHRVFSRMYEVFGEFLMSEIIYTNPASPSEKVKINLADLPINFYHYKKWILETVVASGRTTLYLKQFIDSLINEFVTPLITQGALDPGEPPQILSNVLDVYPQAVIPGSVSLTTAQRSYTERGDTTQDLPGFLHNLIKKRNRDYTGTGATYNMSTNAIWVRDLFKTFKKPPNVRSDPKAIFRGRRLTIISQSPEISKGVSAATAGAQRLRELDYEKNIPHLIFGVANTGLLKNINFEREDMPYRREALLFKGSSWQDNEILAETYNVTVDLAGTTFFVPGTQFYLDPNPLEMGYAINYQTSRGSMSAARAFGLGGYYTVIRVIHNMNLGGSSTWETTLEAKWDSFGDHNGKVDTSPRVPNGRGKLKSIRHRLDLAVDPDDTELIVEMINDHTRWQAQLLGARFDGLNLDPEDY